MELNTSARADSIILVDCDGVLVDWESKFRDWMQQRGFRARDCHDACYEVSERFHDVDPELGRQLIKYFNESAAVRFMQPLRDSVYWVKRLNWKMGYRFRVITSLSRDADAQALREQNLRDLFGDVFDSIVCLATGADKDAVLDQYRDTGCWWIEDKPENAMAGLACGLRPILVTHDHNQHFHHDHVRTARSWQEIYDIIYAAA
jgi:FMN phosphatase YigB (HAD superfamily)